MLAKNLESDGYLKIKRFNYLSTPWMMQKRSHFLSTKLTESNILKKQHFFILQRVMSLSANQCPHIWKMIMSRTQKKTFSKIFLYGCNCKQPETYQLHSIYCIITWCHDLVDLTGHCILCFHLGSYLSQPVAFPYLYLMFLSVKLANTYYTYLTGGWEDSLVNICIMQIELVIQHKNLFEMSLPVEEKRLPLTQPYPFINNPQ